MGRPFALAFGVSVGAHALVLLSGLSARQPALFDVERRDSSVDFSVVAEAAAPLQTLPSVSVAPVTPDPQAAMTLKLPPRQAPREPSVSFEEHRGAFTAILPGYLRNPSPVYPRRSRERGEQGTVVLEVEVLPSGACGAVHVMASSGFSALDRAATEAVQRWLFRPSRRGDRLAPFIVEIPVIFQLTERNSRS